MIGRRRTECSIATELDDRAHRINPPLDWENRMMVNSDLGSLGDGRFPEPMLQTVELMRIRTVAKGADQREVTMHPVGSLRKNRWCAKAMNSTPVAILRATIHSAS
jgi:hypothetical protein